MIIAVDFDGTVVEHCYPKVGPTILGSVETLRKIISSGHKIILWTMRDGKELQDAVNWYKTYEIPLFGININPEQDWTNSPKAYAKMYIDDLALGCPLITPCPIFIKSKDGEKVKITPRPYVNWNRVEKLLILQGVLK